uniref:Transposase n=1 Tax=Romanomermis culicivorax TaxID=13658 RepID=A0A915JTS7_ROMCU
MNSECCGNMSLDFILPNADLLTKICQFLFNTLEYLWKNDVQAKYKTWHNDGQMNITNETISAKQATSRP